MAARTVGGRSNIADILTHEELVQDVLPVATGTVEVNKEHVESFLECAICRGVMQEPVMIKQCLHRFCKNCLEHSLRTLKNECPLCRTRVPSRRSLERDTRFAKLIELVYKDVGEYEAQQSSKLMAAAAASRANAAAILQAARTTRQGHHDQDSAVIREQTARLQRDAAALADVAAAAAATPTAPAVSAGKRPREAPAQAPKATAQPKRARRDEGQADVPPVIFKLGRVPEAGLLGPCFSSGIGGSQGKFHQMP
ncbi:RING1B, partial [Symbiodinium sp. KB8]